MVTHFGHTELAVVVVTADDKIAGRIGIGAKSYCHIVFYIHQNRFKFFDMCELTAAGFQALNPRVINVVPPSAVLIPGTARSAATAFAGFFYGAAFGAYGTEFDCDGLPDDA